MFAPRPALFAVLRAVFSGGLLAVATLLHAADGDYLQTLSPDLQSSAGLARLTPKERTALDQIVAAELSGARRTGEQGLSGTFVSRRSPAELKETGLDRLTAIEQGKLDELVAAALAAQRPKPKARLRLKDDDVINAKARPEVHGSLTLTYGQVSGGHSFQGADLWLDYFIPDWNLNLGFGLSRYTGSGLYDCYPGDYYDLNTPGHGAFGPVYFDATQRSPLRDDFVYGSGETFRAANSWGSLSYSRGRH